MDLENIQWRIKTAMDIRRDRYRGQIRDLYLKRLMASNANETEKKQHMDRAQDTILEGHLKYMRSISKPYNESHKDDNLTLIGQAMHSMQETFLFSDYKPPVMNSAETWLNTFLTNLESWILGFVEGAGNEGSSSTGSVLCTDSLNNAIKEVFALKSYLRVYQLSTAIILTSKVNNATQ
jgi:hypothetical protein